MIWHWPQTRPIELITFIILRNALRCQSVWLAFLSRIWQRQAGRDFGGRTKSSNTPPTQVVAEVSVRNSVPGTWYLVWTFLRPWQTSVHLLTHTTKDYPTFTDCFTCGNPKNSVFFDKSLNIHVQVKTPCILLFFFFFWIVTKFICLSVCYQQNCKCFHAIQ